MIKSEIIRLTEQESFLNYCFNRNIDDVAYWNNWLTNHPEDKDEVEKLKNLLILMGHDTRKKIIENNYEKLQERIITLKPKEKKSLFISWIKWGIAAAAAIILISLAVLYQTKYASNSQLARNNDVAPGGNKAILILANGKKVDLSNISDGAIADESGIKITKTADGQIAYNINKVSSASENDFNTIETPLGGQYQINLPDGTKVWLNSGSSLKYPLKFAGNERNVELMGEGYFEVAHNKAAPFKVKSNEQTVQVLGTHLNIMAYNEEKTLKTTLVEGSVRVIHKNKSAIIKPGQQVQLNQNNLNIVNDIDLEEVTAWKNGYFKFNENLESIMSKIARWYGVEVIYKNTADPTITYSGKISRSRNISAILKIIEFNGDIHFKIDGKKVYVTN